MISVERVVQVAQLLHGKQICSRGGQDHRQHFSKNA